MLDLVVAVGDCSGNHPGTLLLPGDDLLESVVHRDPFEVSGVAFWAEVALKNWFQDGFDHQLYQMVYQR